MALLQPGATIRLVYQPEFDELLIKPISSNSFELINPTEEVKAWIANLGERASMSETRGYANIRTVVFVDKSDTIKFKLVFGEPRSKVRPYSSIFWTNHITKNFFTKLV